MDLRDQLLESSDRKQKGAAKFSIASVALHGLFIAGIVFMSATAVHKVNAEKPIRVFLTNAAAPPPPPPPPPPPASSAPSTPHLATPKPVITQPSFVQPTQIPKELPKVDSGSAKVDLKPSESSSEPAGEPGGVPGGVAGGVVGGVQGGVVGGQLGGQLGGTLGGTVGSTGTAEAKPEPPPPKEEGPLRVGGDVKAPVVLNRAEPQYTEVARKARITGVVVVEAVIDKTGHVDEVKVLKGLPMGLSEAAEEAVKKWKFKPGTLNGEPVDVIFSLTVNFTLQ
jgi:periplasmic protein TonB